MTIKLIKTFLVIVFTFVALSDFACSGEYPCMLYPVYAQTATSSASPSASLRDKLKALDAEIASRAAKLLPTINKKLQNKAYIGFVKSKSTNSFTLALKSGSYIVNVNDYTDYQGDKKLTFKTLAIDDYIAALGDVDESEVLTAKKIIRFPAPTQKDKKVFGGIVTAVTDQTLTIRDFTGQVITTGIDNKTNYKFGSEDSDLSAIKVSKAVYVVSVLKSDKQYARLVYIVPYTLTLPKSKTATNSAINP